MKTQFIEDHPTSAATPEHCPDGRPHVFEQGRCPECRHYT